MYIHMYVCKRYTCMYARVHEQVDWESLCQNSHTRILESPLNMHTVHTYKGMHRMCTEHVYIPHMYSMHTYCVHMYSVHMYSVHMYCVHVPSPDLRRAMAALCSLQ